MKYRRCIATAFTALTLGATLLTLPPQPAQAGIFDVFFPRRGEGRPTGRARGGAVRAGYVIGGTDPTIPYVLSPRNTYVRTNGDLNLRWNASPGATSYTVTVWRWTFEEDRKELRLWETTTTDTEVMYPTDPSEAPPLEVGRYYSVEVAADTGASSETDALAAIGRSGFRLQFPEDTQFLEDDEHLVLSQYLPSDDLDVDDLDNLDDPDLPREEIAIDLAGLYLREELYAETIDLLEPFAAAGTENPIIYEILGNFYSYTGLNGLAIARYQTAAEISAANRDPLGQGIALVGLGEVNAALGNLNVALGHFIQAEQIYSDLELTDAADYVQRRIDTIRRGLS